MAKLNSLNKHLAQVVGAISLFLLLSSSLPAGTIVYDSTDAIFFNPERGFCSQIDNPVSLSLINSLKSQAVSVIQRIYTIPQFRDQALDQNFLDLVEQDFNTARKGGVKLVVRFSYTNDINGQDAPLNIILTHIDQLKPLLQKHYDVIAYMEAGFIGAWGEWYYSTNNLNNTEDRRTVLFALLDALPAQRCVVVRTPDYKRKIFNDPNPLTLEEAFSGSKKARTGAHNDCFLASATDYGTYLENDIQGDKDYLHQDNQFVPQGGETCSPSAYSGCANALKDLAYMHWSVLNKDYNRDVLDAWEQQGCMPEIERRLGYRFRLLQAAITDSARPGGAIDVQFSLVNRGFASLYNPRNLELVLRERTTNKKYRLLTPEDPRYWFSGDTVQVAVQGGLPADMPAGEYEIFIHLADPAPALHDRPEYAIRLANAHIWEDSTGYNALLHQITVDPNVVMDDYTGDLIFEPFTSSASGSSSINIDGLFDDWQNVPQLDTAPDEEKAGDALNADVDLVDLWAADDEDFIYISFSLQGVMKDGYFYHVFFDCDLDTSTGFHSAGSYAGIDYMVENTSLWKYTGVSGEWSWSYKGEIGLQKGQNEPNRVELAVDRNLLAEAGLRDVLGLLFNVNDNNPNVDDDYAPDAYTERSYSYALSVTALPRQESGQMVPEQYVIKTYPNPFNGQITIHYASPHDALQRAEIYNALGQKIRIFTFPDLLSATFQWNGQDQRGISTGSGFYVLKLITRNNAKFSKLILLK
ncbi:DUF4832 domain-containing protein [Calditrichota bacterium LG25]